MKSFLNFILCPFYLLPVLAFGQTVTVDGPAAVYAGNDIVHYGFNVVSSYVISSGSFYLTNSNGSASVISGYTTIGTVQQWDGFYHSSFLYEVVFTSAGNATITVHGGNEASMNVTVKEDWQRPPVVSIVTEEACGSTTVTRLQDPPTGKKWWWANNPTDEGSNFGSGKSILVYLSSQTPLYIRASDLDGTHWSDAKSLGTVTLYKTPPPAPTIATNAKVFSDTSTPPTLSVNDVFDAIYYNWYNAAGDMVHEGRTYQKKFLTTETFYVSTSNGCESSRLPVTVTIVDPPEIVVQGGGSTDITSEPITLMTNQPYDSYQWVYYLTSGHGYEYLSTSSTYQASKAGFYRVFCTMNDVTNTDNRRISSEFAVGSNDHTNYIITSIIQVKDVTDETAVDNLTTTQKNESIQYFDGLGRPSQTVLTQGSPLKKDIVQPFVYDEFGREAVKYQPYVQHETNGWYKTDPIGSQSGIYTSSPQYNFYQSKFAVAKDAAPYAKTIFEASPLNRVLKEAAPGQSWQPEATGDPYSTNDNTVKKRYLVNTDLDAILHFIHNASTDALSLATPSKYYEANQLSVDKTIDEHNNEVISYTDKEGHMVCRKVQYGVDEVDSTIKLYASIYYIYNDFGELVVVLPPEGVKAIVAQSDNE
jgi:hypothetical protein